MLFLSPSEDGGNRGGKKRAHRAERRRQAIRSPGRRREIQGVRRCWTLAESGPEAIGKNGIKARTRRQGRQETVVIGASAGRKRLASAPFPSSGPRSVKS